MVAGDGEQLRMESNGVTAALEHDDAGVVEEPLARRAAHGVDEAAQRAHQRRGRQIEHELSPHSARPRQHAEEQPQRASAAVDGQR